jgi:hypothetical protein
VQPGSGKTPVPEQTVNAVASLRPFATEVNVAGQWVPFPALTAADWLELLMGDLELFLIFPGQCDEDDQEFVDDCLVQGFVDVDEVDEAALNLIETAGGRPWWIVLRMIRVVQDKWGILGAEMTRMGVHPDAVSLSAWLDVLWNLFFQHMDEQKWIMFATQLETPPPQIAARQTIDTMEMSTDSFTSLMRG